MQKVKIVQINDEILNTAKSYGISISETFNGVVYITTDADYLAATFHISELIAMLIEVNKELLRLATNSVFMGQGTFQGAIVTFEYK
jgi:hypothetical protein